MKNSELEKLDRTKGYRGAWFWKEKWFSICSAHGWKGYQQDCGACNAGGWTNVWLWRMGGVVYKVMPGVWRWWVNRPNSKQRKQVESIFPKLKK